MILDESTYREECDSEDNSQRRQWGEKSVIEMSMTKAVRCSRWVTNYFSRVLFETVPYVYHGSISHLCHDAFSVLEVDTTKKKTPQSPKRSLASVRAKIDAQLQARLRDLHLFRSKFTPNATATITRIAVSCAEGAGRYL